MRRTLLAALTVLAALGPVGCGSRDPHLCDFYHSLQAGYEESQGYTPSDIQDEIDQYC